MKKKTIFILSICSLFNLNINAQIPEESKTILSPNAASLGVYGEVPVSHFTGMPEISIPLYEYTLGDFTFPLTLNYHASGIRPDQHPGWTGLGWSLSAGGLISRIVNDMNDEYNNQNYAYGEKSGFYFNHDVLNRDDWYQRDYLRTVAQSNDMLKDTESDIYIFDFLNYHGKFYLNEKGEWKVQCNKPVEVKFSDVFLDVPFSKVGTSAESLGYSPSFGGFTLKAEDGTQYLFGGNDTFIEYSINFFMQYKDDWIATAWYLSKIILPNGTEIKLTYDKGDFINQMYIAAYEDLESKTESSGGIFNPQPNCRSWNITSIDDCYQGKLIAPVYLRKIEFPNGIIEFLRDTTAELRYEQSIYDWFYKRWKLTHSEEHSFIPILQQDSQPLGYPDFLKKLQWYELTAIQIKNYKDTLIKSFTFEYNNINTERLLLKSLTEYGHSASKKDMLQGMKYSFEYNHPEKLPCYLANKTDHWGFYNNTYAILSAASYFSYREPNASVMQYGILNKITYPTGGYTRFEFEPHTYAKQLNKDRSQCENLPDNKIAGGLRIKKIINSDTGNDSDEIITKEYFYVCDFLQNKNNSGKSSGILGGQSQYYFTDYVVFAFNDKNVRHSKSIFSSQSVLPGSNNSCGSHIGYSEVIEKRQDGAFTRYQYTNFDNGHLDEQADAIIQTGRTAYEPYSSKEQERGNLILQEEYDSQGKLKRSNSITYEPDNSSPNNFIRMMKARYLNVCPQNTAVSYDEGTTYRIYTYNLLKSKEIEIIKENSHAPMTSTMEYKYNVDNLLKEIKRTTNNGTRKTLFERPDDFSGNVYNSMIDKHVLSPVIQMTESFSQPGKTAKLVEQTLYNYANWSKVSDNYFAPASVMKSFGGGAIEARIIYNQYDNKGNPLYLIEDGSKHTVYLWGHNYQYLVCEIKNATLTEVTNVIGDLHKFSSAREVDVYKINKLRSALNKAEITSYTYKPNIGISSVTQPNGVTTYYEYDLLGRLKLIKDHSGNIIEAYNYNFKH